jgi:hypothetical protein
MIHLKQTVFESYSNEKPALKRCVPIQRWFCRLYNPFIQVDSSRPDGSDESFGFSKGVSPSWKCASGAFQGE